MSFVEQRRGVRPASVAAVAAVHLVIGYTVISGLAMQVVRYVDPPIVAQNYRDDVPPPPPERVAPPQARARAEAVVHPDTIVDVALPPPNLVIGQIPERIAHPDIGTIGTPPHDEVAPNHARPAGILGNRATWVTTDDYPASSIRAGAQGTTAIVATVGSDGRVSACRVTASSGDRALDEAACRTYSRRARFAPALDEAGKPIATERADRIRWQLPPQ